jgi:hypothetical protein
MAVNMLNLLPKHLLAGLVLLFAASHYQLFAQSPECPTGEDLLSTSDPVYADAMELAQSLRNHGFVVQCVFPTKLGSIFRVVEGGVEHSTIEGEADFRTNYGDVDAVFVPKPQTFAGFKINEHREDGGYFYTFAGTPRVWAVNRFESPRRYYFLKHDNQLLLVSNDRLRARLEEALHLPPQTP